MADLETARKAIGRCLREAIGPLAWCYTVVKLAVFDVDKIAIEWLAPSYAWLLAYKFFVFLGSAVLLLLVLGPGQFLLLLAFVVAYPCVVLFWKLPKRFYRQWPVIVVFLPAIGAAALRLWSTFLIYSIAIFGTLFILVGNRIVAAVGVGLLLPLLLVHLARSLRKAYAASLLAQLASLLEKLRQMIEAGSFVPWDEKAVRVGRSDTAAAGTTPTPAADPRQVAYSSHWLTGLIADRIRAVARRRHYDLYLLASWFYTVLLTATTFALIHLGLQKASAGAYAEVEDGGFWRFFGFSLGILTTSNVSKIAPVSIVANVASYAEVLGSVVILVILVFSILTAAREAFQENLDELVIEIGAIGTALESRIREQFQLTVGELEVALLADMPTYVNSLRKLRGQPELQAAPGVTPTRGANGEGSGGAA